jgi:hypothetical protein
MEIELDFVLNQIVFKLFLKMIEIEKFFKNSKQPVSRVDLKVSSRTKNKCECKPVQGCLGKVHKSSPSPFKYPTYNPTKLSDTL